MNIPLLGARNLVRTYLKSKYENFPNRLSIEISNACNSKCIMCPRTRLTRNIQHMPEPVFKKVLADCGGKPVNKINLFWFGDSFCNPHIISYLAMARSIVPQAQLYISTNAGLLNVEKTNRILEDNLLDVINFDIDGMKKETYEKIRVGVNFDTVCEQVHYFIKRKKQLKRKKPEVRVTIINMRETAAEIPGFQKYWSAYADAVEVNDYNTWLGEMEDRNVGETFEKSVKGSFTYPCIHPWDELVISAEGIAGLCCLDFNLTAPLGNVMEQNLQEIWQGEKINAYRSHLINLNYRNIPCCKNCNAFIYQNNTLWARAWKQ